MTTGIKQVKVCGLVPQLNTPIKEVDYLGMIFYPGSPRYVGRESLVSKSGQLVGVFVNEKVDTILKVCRDLSLSIVQLHGEEPIEQIKELSPHVEVWKAISISERDDINKAEQYAPYVSRLIIDTKGKYRGGNGKTFDWTLLEDYCETTPFMLSGGLSLEIIDDILDFDHPQLIGYDINSRFEINPGQKDWNKVSLFINRIKRA